MNIRRGRNEEENGYIINELLSPASISLIGPIYTARDPDTAEKARCLRVSKNQIVASEKKKFQNFKHLCSLLEKENKDGKFKSKNLVRILKTKESHDYYYVIYENIDAPSLQEQMDDINSPGLEEDLVIEIIFQVIKSLEVLQKYQMGHYGVYPGNIFNKDGEIKLGLPNFREVPNLVEMRQRKLTYTPDERISAKSDIWALGLMIVDLMKGGSGGAKKKVVISYDTRDLIARLVRSVPEVRLDLNKVRLHKVSKEIPRFHL